MYAWAQKYGALTKSKLLCKLFFISTVSKSIFLQWFIMISEISLFLGKYSPKVLSRHIYLQLKLDVSCWKYIFFSFITTSLQAKHLGYINFTENKLQKCYLQFTLIQNTAILSNYWMALSMISTDYWCRGLSYLRDRKNHMPIL